MRLASEKNEQRKKKRTIAVDERQSVTCDLEVTVHVDGSDVGPNGDLRVLSRRERLFIRELTR